MASKRLIDSLGKRLDRRNLVVRMGVGATAGVAALLGVSKAAATYPSFCCNLCLPDYGACIGYTCAWCWYCYLSNTHYNCCEFYNTQSCSSDGCSGALCSHAKQTPYAPTP